ncbi:DUF952 domain-containing protein [Nannocystaceae bacterium ST9]
MTERLFRICEATDWERARVEGVVPRSPLDLRDGFMHLSSAGQVADTLDRHFAGVRGLVLLTVALERLPIEQLRWEPATRGEIFPHLHDELPTSAVLACDPLVLDANGRHRLPLLIERAGRGQAPGERDSSPVGVRVRWNPELGFAELDYPEPMRIGDEATMMAWEALIEAKLAKLVEQEGGKIPLLVRLDNLWVAPKLMSRYLELVDKALVHWIAKLARWSSDESLATMLAHAHDERALPANVFRTREHALAFLRE